MEVFGPVLLSSIPFIGFEAWLLTEKLAFINTGKIIAQEVGFFAMALMIFAVIAFVPSSIFAFLMESAFAKGLQPRSGKSVGLSSLLGTLAGLGVGLIVGLIVRPHGNFDAQITGTVSLALAIYGLLIGCAMGLILRVADRRVLPGVATGA